MLEALSRGITQKMLHGTYSQLNAADEAQRDSAKAAASRLFFASCAAARAQCCTGPFHSKNSL